MGFPLLLIDCIHRSHPLAANTLMRLPADCSNLAPGFQDRDPRVERLTAWIDVSSEAALIALDDLDRWRFSLSVVDAWGEGVTSISSRTWPSSKLELTIVGPSRRGTLPETTCAARARTDVAWVLGRFAPLSGEGPPRAHLIPAGAVELDAHPLPLLEHSLASSVEQVSDLGPEEFLRRVAILARRHPPLTGYAVLRSALHRLGVSERVAAEVNWPPAVRARIAAGLEEGFALIRNRAEDSLPVPDNDWRWAPRGDAPARGTALDRAAHAFLALGAPRAADLIELSCDTDAVDRPLSGAANFEITFPAGELPPAAYWRLSHQGAVASGPTSISDLGVLKRRADGSLTILLQREPPAPACASNWLATPAGRYTLTMQLHAPSASAVDRRWRMPPVVRQSVESPRKRSVRRRFPA